MATVVNPIPLDIFSWKQGKEIWHLTESDSFLPLDFNLTHIGGDAVVIYLNGRNPMHLYQAWRQHGALLNYTESFLHCIPVCVMRICLVTSLWEEIQHSSGFNPDKTEFHTQSNTQMDNVPSGYFIICEVYSSICYWLCGYITYKVPYNSCRVVFG